MSSCQKYGFVFLLGLLPLLALGQDWHPFVEGKKYTWSQVDGGQRILESVEVETSSYQDSNTLFLHSIKCEEWDTTTTLDFYGMNQYDPFSQIVNYDKPAIVTWEGDQVSIFDFNQESKNWWKFEFRPFVHEGDIWETNGFEFKCESESVDFVFGELDSIKTYRCLTTPYDTIEFILSKSHGFVQYSPLRNFHETGLTEPRPYFMLWGTHDPQGVLGYRQPQFEDYFHLNVDDVLVWREKRQGYISDTSFYVDTILQVITTSDKITYQTSQSIYNQDWIFQEIGPSELFYSKEFEGALLEGAISWLELTVWENYSLNPLVVEIDDGDTNVIARFWNTALVFDDESCELIQWTDIDDRRSFSTKNGMTGLHSYAWGSYDLDLIGSVIDGVGEGVVEIPTSVPTPGHLELQLFPNPTRAVVHITNEDITIKKIDLFDLQGRLIHVDFPASNTIDLSSMPSGIYFLRGTDKSGEIYLGTVVKE